MRKLESPEPCIPPQFAAECWFDDVCILDMDYFVKTLSGVTAKGVRPDLIGSLITQYACKWLPELSGDESAEKSGPTTTTTTNSEEPSPESTATASWMKKRFFIEHWSESSLLRKTPSPVTSCCGSSEPQTGHTCGTLLDVELVLRLVKGFVNLDEAVRGGAAMVKVAKLVDSYLAEAAVDSNLRLPEFVALAGALPGHARSIDDELYRAIDTYLKPKALPRSLPPRGSKRTLTRSSRDPSALLRANQAHPSIRLERHLQRFEEPQLWAPEPPARCQSKREMTAQQMEIKRLRDDVLKLQSLCFSMQGQIERMSEKKNKGFFRWKKSGSGFRSGGGVWLMRGKGSTGGRRRWPV
ncbi:hypothetical protein C3L33_00306, partial [Rhododendron williamsianum]